MKSAVGSMRRVAVIAILTVGCVAVAAQAAPGAPAGRQAAPAAQDWSITFRVSGGFAGLARTLRVSSAGDLSAEDARRTGPVTARATPEELTQISSLVANDQPVKEVRPGACRDCLQYAVDIDVKGRRSSFRFDDTTLAGSEVEPLVKLLTTMLNRVLSAQGGRI